MEFKLFYKSYDYKPSLKAMKQFKEATGKDLWSTLLRFMVTFTNSRNGGDSVAELLEKLSDVIDFVDSGSIVFMRLLNKRIKQLRLMRLKTQCTTQESYQVPTNTITASLILFVLYQVALEVQDYHRTIASEKKQ